MSRPPWEDDDRYRAGRRSRRGDEQPFRRRFGREASWTGGADEPGWPGAEHRSRSRRPDGRQWPYPDGRQRPYPDDGGWPHPDDGGWSRPDDAHHGDGYHPPADRDSQHGGFPWTDDTERLVPGLAEPTRPRRSRASARRDDPDWDELDPGGPGRGGPGRGGRGQRGAGRPRRRRRLRRLAPAAAVLIILIAVIPLGVGGFYGYRVLQSKFFPADYSGGGFGQAIVHILPGDTAAAVGQRLAHQGVVASARAFELAAEHSTDQTGLEPGYYRLHKHMKASLAFTMLLNPAARVQTTVTIPEGWRLSRILATLAARTGRPLATYQRAARDTAALGLPSYAHGDPEGYLFPATYNIQPGAGATAVLKAMVTRFDQAAASVNLTRAAARVSLTPGQVITVASLIQAEGGRLSDYPKIAEVIYNRLAHGMKLQLDSTVMYALHTYGIMASAQQLTVNSPYNTYLHTGLPPGPIDSPGAAAISAALHPASGDYLYFVTVNPKTGLTRFTASPTTFERFRAELERNLGSG